MNERTSVILRQRADYCFDNDFGPGTATLVSDEPLPLGVPAARLAHLERVLGQFEAFCTVTQSVGQAIPISTEIVDADGLRLTA